MSDGNRDTCAADDTTPARDSRSAQDQNTLEQWVLQFAAAGDALSKLLVLELRLAAKDTGRLIAGRLAMVPLALLAWLGVSALAAWLAFQSTLSVTWAILAFILTQLAGLVALHLACNRWRKSLALPATRRQLRALKGEGDESQATPR